MEWKSEYKKKLVSAEEAVNVIKSGDVIQLSIPFAEPTLLYRALFDRRDELRGVKIVYDAAAENPGWLEPGTEESFTLLSSRFCGAIYRSAVQEKRHDFMPVTWCTQMKMFSERPTERYDLNVFMTVVSPPNDQGYCSFGASLWNHRDWAKRADRVIVEVDENQIWTFGSNYIHVSEIDYFVENTPTPITDEEAHIIIGNIPGEEAQSLARTMVSELDRNTLGRILAIFENLAAADAETAMSTLKYVANVLALGDPPEHAKAITGHLRELINDGDCIQIGISTPSGWLVRCGLLEGRNDLGVHTEMGCKGLLSAVREGIVTGKHKELYPGIPFVAGTLTGCTPEEIEYAHMNPEVHLYDVSYVASIPTIAREANMRSINNALSVDLTGQINSDSLFGEIFNGSAGAFETAVGAQHSKNGRSIFVMPSTAQNGVISRIVPTMEPGTGITITRQLADTVVTEYGVARLVNKSFRQRAEELIAIAHPDFRAELKEEARKLFYPM